MSVPLLTRHRANLVSIILFALGSLCLYLSGYVVQGVPLVLGLIVITRQAMRGRVYDIVVTTFVFAGAFASYGLDSDWPIGVPVFFGTMASYLTLREFLVEKPRIGLEEIEDLSLEVEEAQNEYDKR